MTKFNPSGPLALLASGFGAAPPLTATSTVAVDQISVVEVTGALFHHATPGWASYELIQDVVSDAIMGPAHTVLLKIDSPGGVVAGCFETCEDLRRLADDCHKPLVAYCTQAASAGYALAAICDSVYLPPTGLIGSIGIIEPILDETSADAAAGVAYHFVTSGARKTDGNPHTGITAAAIAATQERVDIISRLFSEMVARHRDVDPDDIRALEAGLLVGQDAVDAGLADGVATFADVVALLSDPAAASVQQPIITPTPEPVAPRAPMASAGQTKGGSVRRQPPPKRGPKPMTAMADIERACAKIETKHGIIPPPGANVRQRVAAIAARSRELDTQISRRRDGGEGAAQRHIPPRFVGGLTAAGGSNLSGRGEELDRMMGIRRPRPIVETQGTNMVMHVATPREAREWSRRGAQ